MCSQNKGKVMKRIKLLTLALSAMFFTSLKMQATGNKVIGCAGYQVVCDQSMNAVGDRLKWDTTDATKQDLGEIKEKSTALISFPMKNSKIIYSFTLTAGPLEDMNIEALFVTLDLNNLQADLHGNVTNEAMTGMKNFPGSDVMIKVYRRLEGEQLWTEMGASFGVMPTGAPIIISPDGNVDITSLQPAGHPAPSIIYFGVMI